jgi:hypothetical protein
MQMMWTHTYYMLAAVVSTDNWSNGSWSANLKYISAVSSCWLGSRKWNEIQTKNIQRRIFYKFLFPVDW